MKITIFNGQSAMCVFVRVHFRMMGTLTLKTHKISIQFKRRNRKKIFHEHENELRACLLHFNYLCAQWKKKTHSTHTHNKIRAMFSLKLNGSGTLCGRLFFIHCIHISVVISSLFWSWSLNVCVFISFSFILIFILLR